MATTRLEFDVLANDRASGKLDKIGKSFGRFGTIARTTGNDAAGAMGRMGAGIAGAAKLGGAGLAVLGASLVAAAPKVFDMAGQLELMGKKSAVVFGDQLGSVDKWAKTNANAMGLTKREATGLAAGFADLLIPMGFSRKAAADMSTKMIGLSGALSEWSGGTRTAAEVSDILSAAMMGERDALQGLGISISQAEVDAKALEMGLAKGAVNMNQVKTATIGLKEAQQKQSEALKEHGKGSLEYEKATAAIGTAQDRLANATKGSKAEISDQAAALATQQLIMEKSTDAQTAYADGAGSLARKTAESKAKLKDMGQELLVKATPALTSLADILATKVIPKIAEFGRFIDENKFQIQGAFIDIALAVTGLVKTFGPALQFMDRMYLDFIQSMVDGAAKAFGWVPGLGDKLKGASAAFGKYREVHDKAFDGVIAKSKEWNTQLGKLKTEVKLKADISNWENQLKTAKTQVTDKTLTKERKATLKANIADLETKIRTAKGQLAQPQLTATKTAFLHAYKKDLDDKLAAAKKQLNDPKLTATKKAQITANIENLQRNINNAQTKINSLKGKSVSVDIKFTSAGVNLTTPSSVGRRAAGGPGGPVRGPGSTTSDQAGLFALSRKEWVIKARSSEKYGDYAMASVNAGTATIIPGLAAGGKAGSATIQTQFDAAIRGAAQKFAKTFGPFGPALGFAKAQAGSPYRWGSAGPGGFDCSGFMSAITNYIRGKSPFSRLGSTGTFPWPGFARGPGAFMIGSFRGNPGHMAGTLMGTNVESRGGEGVVVGSRARGAQNRLFGGNVWHLARLAAGGKAGDAAFDLLDPRGRDYLGSRLEQAISRGVLNRDNGGPLPTGTSLVHNGTGRPEWIDTGSGQFLGTVRFELTLDGKTIQTKLLKLKRTNGGLALGLA